MQFTVKKRKAHSTKAWTLAALLIGSVIMLLPFVWMVLTSFKTYAETVKLPIVWLPAQWNFSNYVEVLEKLDFLRYYQNTILVTVITCALQMFLCSLCAYTFARMEFPLKKFLFGLMMIVFMVPAQMTMIPKYLIMVKLNWVDTLAGIIVPSVFSVYTVFMLRQFFAALPREMEDSAKIDGCSYFRIYWNILLPLCKSAMVAMLVLNVLWCWNELTWPLVVTSSDRCRVLSVAMATLQGQHGTQYHLMMAAGVMSVLPMLLLYIICQKSFISGIAFSGLKG